MRLIAMLLVSAALVAACQPATAPNSTADAANASSAAAQPTSFTVGDLGDNDWSVQGCQTMLSRVGAAPNAGLTFAEDAVDTGAKGFIKINGAVLNVALISSTGAESGPSVRTFADAAHTVTVVETTTPGEAHEEADSVEAAGTLAVTFGGETQTIAVEGGTAC